MTETCFALLEQIDYIIDQNEIQGIIPTATPPIGETPSSVSFKLKKSTTLNGKIYCRVWDTAPDVPGSPAHTYGEMAANDLTTSYVKYTFSIGTHPLTATSHIGIEYDGTVNNACWMLGQSSPASDGTWWYYDGSIGNHGIPCPYFCYDATPTPSTGGRLPPPPIVLGGL